MTQIPAGYSVLRGSRRRPRQGAQILGPADPKEKLTVTIGVRRRADAPSLPDLRSLTAKPIREREYLKRTEHAERFGADPADLDRVTRFVRSLGMEVVESSAVKRTVTISGTVEQMSRAFCVELNQYRTGAEKYREREGPICLPDALAETVRSVFGLEWED